MDIIELDNRSKEPGQSAYPTTSLGNKSLEKVVGDIVERLTPGTEAKGGNGRGT